MELSVELQIVSEYKNGARASVIAEKYSISSSQVRRTVRRHGIDTSLRTSRRHSLNENAFCVVGEQSAYWIGFLMADGYVAPPKRLCLHLAARDKNHLRSFCAFLGSSSKITTIPAKKYPTANNSEAVSVTIFSKAIIDDLITFGVTKDKTFKGRVNFLEQNRNFWRGVVDGDGSLYEIKRSYGVYLGLGLVGSEPLLKQFADFIESAAPGKRVVIHKKEKIFEIKIAGKRAKKVASELYDNCTVALDRKKAISDRFCHGKSTCQ